MSKKTRLKKCLIVVVAFLAGSRGHLSAEFVFGPPVNLGPDINSAKDEFCVEVSDDGLCLIFSDSPSGLRPGGKGNTDIWMTTRQAIDESFGPAVNVAELNTGYHEFSPTLSVDGLTVFFASDRPGGRGDLDLWEARRPAKTAPFGQPENLGSVNSGAGDFCPCLSADGLELYFNSPRWGGYGSCDIYVAKRNTVNSPWGTPVKLGPRINSSASDGNPQISNDGLRLFYGSFKSSEFGGSDLYMVTRETKDSLWGIPVNMGPTINTSADETSISICEKASVMFIASSRPGSVGDCDIWQVSIMPVVDLDNNGVVNFTDFCCFAPHLYQEQPSADIAPAPFGDGVMDVRDVAVLAEHWLEDVGLIAHWKLDEVEGFVAHDSAGDNDAFVLSANPLWRPTDGIVNGALDLDGIHDFVSVPFVLDPAEGSFSVFAWIKGGAAGQVALSQIGAANWLLADAEGKLMTELKGTGRFGQALIADAVIIDGNWHRVGLTWDDSIRTLYVDDIEAAADTQTSLPSCSGGLYIGASKDPTPGSFFSGLIDDVKIYTGAITP